MTMSDSPESEIRGPIFDKFENESEEPSNAEISITPNTELSPPDSPTSQSATLNHVTDRRSKSATLAASLSLEEQVRQFVPFVRVYLVLTTQPRSLSS
jgi:hypothetical protein